jgi:4-hydroxy-2-oxoheptanedioate aldolase
VKFLRATDVNKLQEAKKTGSPLLGMFLNTCSPDLAELLGYSGIEYLFIDNEHQHYTWETLANVMRACELSGIFPMVRINKQYPGYPSNIRKAFEIGAGMVLVPHINTREEAVAAVRAAKFGPDYEYGPWPADQVRGAGSDSRAGKYWTIEPPEHPVGEYFRLENKKRMVGIMLEESQAFENAEEIMSVEGLDNIGLGFGDLSVSLGYPGQGVKAPGVSELLDKYNKAMQKHPDKFIKSRGLDWMEVLTDYDKAKSKIKDGLKEGAYLFMLPSERGILKKVIQRCAKALNEAVAEIKEESG